MVTLEGEPVASSTALGRAIGWGELRERYDVDGFEVHVDDPEEAERLVQQNPHLSFADSQPEPPSGEVVRAEATNEGVEFSDEPDTCETVKNDGDVCGRELPCPYHD